MHILVCSGLYRCINLARERLSLIIKLKFIYLFILRKTKGNEVYPVNIFSHVFFLQNLPNGERNTRCTKYIVLIYREKLSPRNKLNFSHSHIFVS